MLTVVGKPRPTPLVSVEQALADHHHLIDSFSNAARARGMADVSIAKDLVFLKTWFAVHGPQGRLLFVWEAMDSYRGRQHLIDYRDVLVEAELQTATIRSYLGILRRFFEFVLAHPVLFNQETPVMIQDRYGVQLHQPVSDFDMPRFIWDGEKKGVPLDPERLYDFYQMLRREYLGSESWIFLRQRNYAMAVLAGESGLRVDELLHLEVDKDLFFESHKIQTRHAKGAKGSGKRTRLTLFTPLARDTLKYYLKIRRQHWREDGGILFLSKTGLPLTYNAAQAALKEMVRVCQRANFPVMDHLTWHWFRRIFATRFVERFPNRISSLVGLLGHMSPNTVHRYIRHSESWMDAEIKAAMEGATRWPSTGT